MKCNEPKMKANILHPCKLEIQQQNFSLYSRTIFQLNTLVFSVELQTKKKAMTQKVFVLYIHILPHKFGKSKGYEMTRHFDEKFIENRIVFSYFR